MFVAIILSLGLLVGSVHGAAADPAVRISAPTVMSGGGVGAMNATSSGGGVGAMKPVRSGGGVGAMATTNSGGGVGALKPAGSGGGVGALKAIVINAGGALGILLGLHL